MNQELQTYNTQQIPNSFKVDVQVGVGPYCCVVSGREGCMLIGLSLLGADTS